MKTEKRLRRTVEKEREELGWESWRAAENEARGRQGWRAMLNSLMLP